MDTDNKPTPGADAPTTDSDKSVDTTKELEAAIKRAESAEAEAAKFRKAAQERDAAKKREREEAEKAGEYQKVIESLKSDNETLAAKTAKYDEMVARIEAMEKQERDNLLSQLPDDVKEKSKDLPTDALRVIVEAIPKIPNVNTDKSKASSAPNKLDVAAMSDEEFAVWKADKTPEEKRAAAMKRAMAGK